MIRVKIGDLFESDAQTLVNAVNCVGVMGKGIALEFKIRFPEMYVDYVKRCKAVQVTPGKPYLYPSSQTSWVLNFPTKTHWRDDSKLPDILAGLEYLKTHYEEWGVTSLACPALGCGHGNLEWRIAGPILYRHLSQMDIPLELYAPTGTPPEQITQDFLAKGRD